MASLEMLTVNANLTPLSTSDRILRKRIPKHVPTENLNRRCSLKPKKRTFSEMETEDEIKDYYLDKSIKKVQNTLETIYEEKDGTNQSGTVMSVKRYKRMIQFQGNPTESKIKKRRARIRKVFGSKMCFKSSLVKSASKHSMQKLLDKLNGITGESPSKTENEVK